MSVKNQAKYIYSLSVVLMIFIVSILTTAFGSEITGRIYELYDIQFKTDRLGLYQVTIESHERPSHETLPFISSSYFPYSTLSDQTEVDNTAPEARYHAQGITKVDVVFATGELSQSSQMQDYMDTFESNLQSASNFIDAYVEKVETSTIKVDESAADVIMRTWLANQTPPGSSNWSSDVASQSWRLSGDRLLSLHGPRDSSYYYSLIQPDYGQISVPDFEMTFTYGLNHNASDFGHGESGFFIAIDPSYSTGYGIMVDNHSACGNLRYNGYAILFRYTNGQYTALEAIDVGMYRAGGQYRFTVSVKNNIATITYYSTVNGANGTYRTLDLSGIPNRTYGFYTYRQANAYFSDISVTSGSTKTLGEAISDVAWRDGSLRFVIHATDIIPIECETGNDDEFAYTVTKLLNSNCYLINLGNNTNITQLNRLVEAIRESDGTNKGTFFYNNRPNVTTAMDQSADYIIDLARNLVKPVDWILVNTEILWNTTYNDQENDPPLNLGEHNGQYEQPQDTSDITLAQSYGLGDAGRTKAYTGSKLLAERWRYRHYNTFFDNSPVQVSWHEVWIENPVSIFEYPGKYRINYKRRDNPLYPSVDLNDAFDSYRYWSTNYDYLTSSK